MDDCRWIPMTMEHVTGEWHVLDLGCRYIGPDPEWSVSHFPQVDLALAGGLCAAHRLDYLPTGLSPFHYPL